MTGYSGDIHLGAHMTHFVSCRNTRRPNVGDEESDEEVTDSVFDTTQLKERRRQHTHKGDKDVIKWPSDTGLLDCMQHTLC